MARKILSSINLRNFYVTHLFNLHKINLNDVKHSRKTLLKVMAAFFFVKSWIPDQFNVLTHWYQNSFHYMKNSNTHIMNNYHHNHPTHIYHANIDYPNHRNYALDEVSFSKKLRPYSCRCMSSGFKGQVLEEANIGKLSDSSQIIHRTFRNRKKHRFFEEKPLTCSPCQFSHGERMVASNINRGRANYTFSKPFKEIKTDRVYCNDNRNVSFNECHCHENPEYTEPHQIPASARYFSVSIT